MYSLDKKLMKKFDKEKDSFLEYLRSIGLTPVDDNPEADYPLTQSFSSPHGLFIANERLKKYGLNVNDLYKRNSLRYRCDEFTDKHEGKHILFAGCSVTYGDSLPEEFIWPRIIYDKIASQEATSGYFNLGKPGGSPIDILNGIIEYIDRYGMPDVVFILFPDKIRDVTQFDALDNEFLEHKIHMTTVYMYRLLRDLLRANGKQIFSTSWSEEAALTLDKERQKAFYYPLALEDSFVQFVHEDLVGYIYNFDDLNKSHPFRDLIMKAGDLAHPGIAEHEFYATLLYNSYYEKTNSEH